MTTKTRYFVIVSLLTLGVGLGTGVVAYYVGFPAGASASRGGPAELGFVPRDASVIAFANVHEIMGSELRQKLRRAIPIQQNGQQELENQTGINIETDIDSIVACMSADAAGANPPGAGMVLARGRFDETKIEALMRERGAHVETYSGKRVVVADPQDAATDPSSSDKSRHGHPSLSLSFMEPGLAAIGSTTLIRSAIDLHKAGNNPQAGLESVTGNDELMNLVRSLDNSNAWAVGRFDALRTQSHLPANVLSQLPAISWFAVSAHINGGLRGTLRAEARDDESANSLRDVVRGFLALAKLGSGAKPELQATMQSLELGGTGKTVSLSFAVPAELFDVIGAAATLRKPAVR
ncbi:MAG TPA: hypothetical protein VHT95_01390 [Vicinamibacterales bacterium]|nr:hypothetical protein [Vicinamibacterales bacterium]